MLMLTLAVWALSGVAAAMIYQSKNRNPLHGAIWGVLLGVFGVLICACRSKIEPGQVNHEAESRQRVLGFDMSDRR